MMTCEKKYSNSSDPAILKLWPTQILRRTLTLLPSETERGRRDSEIQVGSSQDNIVESFIKFAHIIVKTINTMKSRQVDYQQNNFSLYFRPD